MRWFLFWCSVTSFATGMLCLLAVFILPPAWALLLVSLSLTAQGAGYLCFRASERLMLSR
jgi:hypothetical protein